MRTTVLLDDKLGKSAQSRARREGLSFSALVERALREHLAAAQRPPAAAPFRLITVGGEGVYPGVDLDRTSELLVAEDESEYRGGGEE